MEKITGTVHSIVFAGEENGFTVAKLHTKESKDPISIVGVLPSLQPGESLICQGSWKNHTNYGKQFEVVSFESCIPSDLIGIQKYLESGFIKGIGPTYAKKIITMFGLSTLKIIDEEPNRLSEVPGIGAKRLSQIISCWQDQRAIREVMIFLRGHQVSSSYAQKIYKMYKEKSIEKVSENPFALTKEIFGIGFKTADKIAESLGILKDSPKRIDAGIEFVFRELAGEGHTCFPYTDFVNTAQTILEVPSSSIEERLSYLTKKENLVQENNKIWVRFFHQAEVNISKELQRILEKPSPLRRIDSEKAIAWVEDKLRIHLAQEQAEAVVEGARQKLMIITGGPGTGKSTITKAILRISEQLTSKILLAAPTGRAAKRMSEITYKKAFTIHSLLEMDFLTKQFKKNRENPISCDLLIIDEASMIDTLLMNSLLKAIPDHCRVIFIGDVDQLPSVGAGNVLKDLISSEKIPVFRLKKIFRQAANSRIITNAHKVNKGFFPDLTVIPGSDFLFLDKKEPEEILEELLKQAEEKQITHKGKYQILAPMKKGIIGIDNLNMLLQKKLNPSANPLLKMGRSFHLHDKVMQIRNNYQKEAYNGDVGTITAIDMEEEQLEVCFDETPVIYEFTELDELVLAYAVSIHKYQGSECDCIILPIHTSHFKLLNKNLLYTAITRGKKLVTLIGSIKAIAIAVRTEGAQDRHTGLKESLSKA
ncbi:MAG: ATP-dependent RecD-like DNA helicase [Chlamydiota bacterium]